MTMTDGSKLKKYHPKGPKKFNRPPPGTAHT